VLILDERHQIHVVRSSDDENALAAVTLGVRVLQDIEQVASLDVEDDFFEPDAALRPELRVLRVVPVELLHRHSSLAQRVLNRHTLASAPVARQCAQTQSEIGGDDLQVQRVARSETMGDRAGQI